MSRTIFRKTTGFSTWVLVAAGLGLALMIPGFIGGKEFMFFFGCMGGMWIMVALLIAVVVALAGKGQVVEMSLDGENVNVRTVGLFGPGRSLVIARSDMTNWRWLTQGANRNIGPRLLMLAFDYRGKTRRLPISTAEVVDLDGLRAVAPVEVIEDMIANNPGRVPNSPVSI